MTGQPSVALDSIFDGLPLEDVQYMQGWLTRCISICNGCQGEVELLTSNRSLPLGPFVEASLTVASHNG